MAIITDSAPEAFGLAWEYSRPVRGGRRIYVATADTGAYADAYRRCYPEMRALGFTYAEPWHDDEWKGLRPAFFLSPQGWDKAAVEEVRALVPIRIREERARRAQEEERHARRDAELAASREEARLRRERFVEDARAAAQDSLTCRRWAWARPALVEEAEALLAREDLDEAAATRLLALAANADATVARAGRAAAVPVAAERTLASDPAIREGCLHAVRYLTVYDSDRATIENGLGWGRTTTVLGHVLAGMEELSEAQATHALRILRIHRRQLPPALDAAVFQGVPLELPALDLAARARLAAQAELSL